MKYKVHPVSAHLRRVAPIQPHDDRRAFLKAADVLEGARLEHETALYMLDIPVGMNGVWVGHVEVSVELIDGEPAAIAVYKPKVDDDAVGKAAGR